MFGLLKKLFKKSEPEAKPSPQPAKPTPAARQAPSAAPPPKSPQPAPSRAEQPKPAAQPAPQHTPTAVDGVQVSLAAIVSKFPEALQGAVAKSPGSHATVALSLDAVLTQLASGKVQIPYSELLSLAPEGFLNSMGVADSTLIEIPLTEILSKLKPDQLPRRQGQRRVEVPDDIQPLFGAKGHPMPNKAPVTAPKSSGPSQSSKPAPPPPAAPPVTPPPAPQEIKPASGLPDPGSLRPAQAMPTKPVGTGAAPAPSIPKPAPLPSVKPSPPPAPAPAPASSPAPAALPVTGDIRVNLGQLIQSWPEAAKQAAGSALEATVEIPPGAIESGIRKGRIQVKGSVIKSWIKEASVELDDTVDYDLPVPLLAPMFLLRKSPSKPQRRVTVSDNIPELFAGKTPAATAQPAASASPTPSAPTPTPVPEVPKSAPAPAPATAPARTLSTLADIFQQPGKTSWTPQELVQQVAALKGVSGAVITMSDGLLVAGKVPPALQADLIAGFVPEMFTRINQYSKEIRLGEIQQLSFNAGSVVCQVFQASKLYLAILTAADVPLAASSIDLILKELGRQPAK